MSLKRIYSHPESSKYTKGKPLTTHIEHVLNKALKKYYGPEKYIKYIELTAIFHDIGKINPNFQKYLFIINKDDFGGRYKNHGYLSAITLILLIISNKQFFIDNDYDLNLLGLIIILIAKHHCNLPDIVSTRDILSETELEKVWQYFKNEVKVSKEYLSGVEEFLDYFKFNLTIDSKSISKNIFRNTNRFLLKLVKGILEKDKLNYFMLSQYIFSCVIEADKRDASDNDEFLLKNELEVFNPKYFYNKLQKYYSSFKNKKVSSNESSLNKVRTEIKSTCVKNVEKYILKGERIFQIIAPTGSGKTLTFLSVSSAIKLTLKDKGLKIIYAIPFLSITDQITKECEKVFDDHKNLIYRIDSSGKTINEDQKIKEEKNNDTKDSKIDIDNKLILEDFAEHTFDHAFVVTTFVKLFETLTANRNRDLLRYNNFSKSIIIIDEIQALPPRTYTFLVALLEKYAKLFDSYIIIGSATVPMFEFPDNKKALIKEVNGVKVDIRNIFVDYTRPVNLLDDYKDKFKNINFCRYKIVFNNKKQSIEELAQNISKNNISTLCVLNTKRSSKKLFSILNRQKKEKVFLLNTFQTLKDRRLILDDIKGKLRNKEEVYLISTQLIEAGIDISFPLVYRDLAPFPSIVQAAGRCNRNHELGQGTIIITQLIDEKGKAYYSYIYHDLMDFTQRVLIKFKDDIKENNLLEYQQQFFDYVRNRLEFGKYKLKYTDLIDKEYFLQHTVNNFEYNKLGQFSLIDSSEFDVVSIFIIQSERDKNDLQKLSELKQENFSFAQRIKIQRVLRHLSDRIISLPVDLERNFSLFSELRSREIFGLSYIDPRNDVGVSYSKNTGLVIKTEDNILLI